VTSKLCPACKGEKSEDEFYKRGGSKRPYGRCKPCIRQTAQKRVDLGREAKGLPPIDRASGPAWDAHGRTCSKCKGYKGRDAYTAHPNSPDGLNSACRECVSHKLRIEGGYIDQWKSNKRTCRKCKKFKPWGKFPARDRGKNQKSSVCYKCTRKRNLAYAQDHKKAIAESRLRRLAQDPEKLKYRYGLTPEEFNDMLEESAGLCQVCGRSPKRLVIDHNHHTGHVRGLLCDRCNVKLFAVENVDVLIMMIDYLRRTDSRDIFGEVSEALKRGS
jgi:hypothetical protein